MKIAVIGSGISGLAAAHYLAPHHDITLYEAADRLGGHTATIDVDDHGHALAIDTGFIVFNDWTYPHFIALLDELDVRSLPTEMSFSVSDAQSGLEYAGTNLNTLFAQRRNLVSPQFWQLLRDIVRFNRSAEDDLLRDPTLADATLGHYLRVYGYGCAFHDYYLIPMGAAIWSSGHEQMERFPLKFFIRFFRNHGLLNLLHRPQWRVIEGGSRAYIEPLTRRFRDGIRLSTPVQSIRRESDADGRKSVVVQARDGAERYDHVVLACHSDQALRLLADPAPAERDILGAIPYSRNEVVLHTDASLLPRSRRAWSSWNVNLVDGIDARPMLTYDMNILQRLQSKQTWCVTLNQTARIRPECIKGVFHYEHPEFTLAGHAAQQRWHEINGESHTWFCGAWWRNGFHEDGVWSALRVAEALRQLPETTA